MKYCNKINNSFILTAFLLVLTSSIYSQAKHRDHYYSSQELTVTNPILSWGTFFGNTEFDSYTYARGCISDLSGYVYIVGSTDSPDNIATPGSFQPVKIGQTDAFLEKFDSGGERIWGTYIGSGTENAYAVTLDHKNNIILVGATQSNTGIATTGAWQTQYAGNTDGFIEKFTTDGNRLWGTYLGSTGSEQNYSVSVDTNDNILVCGITTSDSGFATPAAWQSDYIGDPQYGMAFFAKFNSSGALIFCSYYGGESYTQAWTIHADKNCRIIIGGETDCTSHITSQGCQQPVFGGWIDGFLAEFDTGGNRLWGTYLGGNWGDAVVSVASDTSSDVYAAGYTGSINNIATPGAHKESIVGEPGWDGFIEKYDGSGQRIWGTYFGGQHDEYINKIILSNDHSNIFFGGETKSTLGIATPGAHQENWYFGLAGNGDLWPDGFIAGFDLNGNQTWGTYIGGPSYDGINDLAVGKGNSFFYAGDTQSDTSEFMVTPGCFQGRGYSRYSGFFGDFTFDVASIIVSPENSTFSMKIAPNPCFQKACNIFASEIIKSINIYTLTGKTVFSKKDVFQSELEIDISDLQVGMYILKADLRHHTAFKKLIVGNTY